MGSPLSFFHMHWDHEPTPNPSQEGNFRGRVNGPRGSVWSACVFSAAFPREAAIPWPGRFMESLMVCSASDSARAQPIQSRRGGLDIYGVVGQKHDQRERECDV